MPLGAELQQQRAARGIPLERVAEQTKLPLRQLQMLEADNLEALPGGIFRRGVVRAYCNCVGLPEEDWLQRLPSVEVDEGWWEFAENVRRNRVVTGAPRHRWVGVVLMLAAVAAAAWAVWHFLLRARLGL